MRLRLVHFKQFYPQISRLTVLNQRFQFLATELSNVLKICIVGAGPAGLYTADRLIKRFKEKVSIDVIDKLPFPFGLVKTGVAPDHPSTKNVIKGFTKTLKSSQCSFFGNVSLGSDITIAELRNMYHGVVLACGAENDRKLKVPGEDGKGVLTAREFVWWYNGHPECSDVKIELSKVKNVGIIGAGNVALDCARILLKPWTLFQETDMSPQAISSLKDSAVENVYIIARRGPAHIKFTPKELREVLALENTRYHFDQKDLRLSKQEAEEIAQFRQRRRNVEILRKGAEEALEAAFNSVPFERCLHFYFKKSIKEICLDKESCIQSVYLNDTSNDSESTHLKLDVDLLITSLGNKGFPIDDVPFDEDKCVIPNVEGRVTKNKDSEEAEHGLYVSGWLKRGATGIIGTNIIDAEEVTHCIHIDASSLLNHQLKIQKDLKSLLAERNTSFAPFEDK